MIRAVWLLVLVAGSVATAQPAGAAARPVTFRAEDGRMVAGAITEAARRPAPAVVLVPMLGRPKEDWQTVAERLAEGHVTVLSIDLRAQVAPADPRELERWHEDVRAAVTFLTGRNDVRPDGIGVAGASLGADLAAVAAGVDARIRSLVLVSPSLDYRGVRIAPALRKYGQRPALLLASRHDPYAARTVRELAKDGPATWDVRWSDAEAHGTILLMRDPDLVGALVQWFQRTLGVN
jgi:acetyl esterase/lipase